MSEGPAALYASLIGMPMVAVNHLGIVYAEGTVESVHVKPIGSSDQCFYAKLSDGKYAPVGDLIHGRPMGSGNSTACETEVEAGDLLPLAGWFAREIERCPRIRFHEYKLSTVAEALGYGGSVAERSHFGKWIRNHKGAVITVRFRRLHEKEISEERYRLDFGFAQSGRVRTLCLTAVFSDPSEGKETEA